MPVRHPRRSSRFWLILIVGAALGAAYLMDRALARAKGLVDAKLEQLERRARRLALRLVPADQRDWQGFVDGAAYLTDARVAVVSPFGVSGRPSVAVLGIPGRPSASDLRNDPIACRARRTRRGRAGAGASARRGLVRRGSGAGCRRAYTVLFSEARFVTRWPPFRVVKRRLLYAAAAALGIAGSARHRSPRRGAGSAASGGSSAQPGLIAEGAGWTEPVVDLGDDEIGQLAEAFDRMRRAARTARHGAPGVRGERLARAAHAAFLARGVPRADDR